MKLLILFQVLTFTINICESKNNPNATTHFRSDFRAEIPVKHLNKTKREDSKEFFDDFRNDDYNGNDLDFDYDEDKGTLNVKEGEVAEKQMQEALFKAMKKPVIRKQIGEVIPILRVMSPAQRLTLAALVSSQIKSQNTLSEPNLTEVASMFAGKNLENADDRNNVTEYLLLPISMDIAKMFRGLGREVGRNLRENIYKIHKEDVSEEKLKRRLVRKPGYQPPTPSAKRRIDDFDYYELEEDNKPTRPLPDIPKQPAKEECDYFTKSLCLEVSNYPTEAIISSLKENADIAKTFLADFDVKSREDFKQSKSNYGRSRNLETLDRRQDDKNEIQNIVAEGNFMCPTAVKYARPKRARTTAGHWKYIVNTGDYTQTLRLEICTKPKSPCSFVASQINSECAQVFNYHRLLTWDENKGLHMDVFKVPSCCSCHIQGYSDIFPPTNEYTFAEKRKEPANVSEFPPVVKERPKYNNLGNAIEGPKIIPLGNAPTLALKPQVVYQSNIKDYIKNPSAHLVPPGPPLPLENEGKLGQSPDSKYYNKKGTLDHTLRYQLQTESLRNKVDRPESKNPTGNLILPSTRLKTQGNSPLQRPNLVHPHQTHHSPAILPTNFEQDNVFEQSGQIRYIIPLSNTPPPFQKAASIRRAKPNDAGLFNSPNRDYKIQNGFKSNTRQSNQHYNQKYNDNKIAPSRGGSIFATPPKLRDREIPASTTSSPKKSELMTSSGQKKINYNYHPIIDFFRTDSNSKKGSVSSGSQNHVTSQDWTPVLGHQSLPN